VVHREVHFMIVRGILRLLPSIQTCLIEEISFVFLLHLIRGVIRIASHRIAGSWDKLHMTVEAGKGRQANGPRLPCPGAP